MLEIIFELGINLIETLIMIDFVTRYLGSSCGRIKSIIGFCTAWMISFAELSIINYITDFEGIAVCIPVLIYFVYAVICLDGSILMKLWVSVLVQILSVIIAIVTNLIICELIGYEPSAMMSVFNITRIVGVLITKIMQFYVFRIILRHRYKHPMDKHIWVMLIIIPVISLISLSALMLAAINHEEIKTYILCGMSGIVLANGVTYYFFTRINKDYETQLRMKLLEQQNENAKKNIENANAFVGQMKSVKHDIQNHLLILYNYIYENKYSEAENYIKQFIDDYLPHIQSMVNTNNDAFNAIVNSKIAVCTQKKIYIEVNVMKDALVDFDTVDTCILFGNLLDNAIEAAENTIKKRITVDIKIEGEYLSVLISNSINDSVLKNNQQLMTSKEDKSMHGIGIKTIKNIVNKYDGMIQFFEESNEFCCHILLNIAECRN